MSRLGNISKHLPRLKMPSLNDPHFRMFVTVVLTTAVVVLVFASIHLDTEVQKLKDGQKLGRGERRTFQYESEILSCHGIRLADPEGAGMDPVQDICADVPQVGQTTTTAPPE